MREVVAIQAERLAQVVDARSSRKKINRAWEGTVASWECRALILARGGDVPRASGVPVPEQGMREVRKAGRENLAVRAERLARLLDLRAPSVILLNEWRLLQRAWADREAAIAATGRPPAPITPEEAARRDALVDQAVAAVVEEFGVDESDPALTQARSEHELAGGYLLRVGERLVVCTRDEAVALGRRAAYLAWLDRWCDSDETMDPPDNAEAPR